LLTKHLAWYPIKVTKVDDKQLTPSKINDLVKPENQKEFKLSGTQVVEVSTASAVEDEAAASGALSNVASMTLRVQCSKADVEDPVALAKAVGDFLDGRGEVAGDPVAPLLNKQYMWYPIKVTKLEGKELKPSAISELPSLEAFKVRETQTVEVQEEAAVSSVQEEAAVSSVLDLLVKVKAETEFDEAQFKTFAEKVGIAVGGTGQPNGASTKGLLAKGLFNYPIKVTGGSSSKAQGLENTELEGSKITSVTVLKC